MKFTIAAVLMVILTAGAQAQQTLTITASKDNTLYQTTDGSVSNGSGVGMFTGRTIQAGNNLRRAVVMFNLNALPANAVITWVKLKLNMSKSNQSASAVKVHKLLADWGEGTSDAGSGEGGGTASTTNDATWIHRFFNTQSWSTPGGDFVSTASASLIIDAVGFYTWEDTLLWNDALSWKQNPSTNFGWILIGDESAASSRRFDTRNHATAANRPQLIVEYTTPNSVNDGALNPSGFHLEQNHPNPFNPTTSIAFSIPQSGHTSLKVYDVLGNEVASLADRSMEAGRHTVKFDGSRMASGMYFYRLHSGSFSSVKKLLLVK